MIDIHTHILPGIDDGADTIETSLGMLKIAQEDGIKKVIATSHYYKGYFETNYQEVLKLVDDLNKKAIAANIDVEILPGQEVFLHKDVVSLYKEGKINTLNNTKYMLIELPFDDMPSYTLDTIYELRLLGIIPVLAHPERYGYIVKKPANINQFIEEGCLFQITSGSLTGLFGRDVQKTAEILVNNRICHFIASDAHTTNKRCPQIRKSFDIIGEKNIELAIELTKNVEIALNNCDINHCLEKISEKTRFFDLFRRKP